MTYRTKWENRMSAKKTTAKAGGLTPEQWAKFGHALQASKDEQARREAPKKTARALLGKFDGVENWGEYAAALRDCAADINDMLASDEILRIPSRTEFEAEDTAADLAGATMMAMDYRIGMMEAKYYLTLMTALFGAYVEANKRDPVSKASLFETMEQFKQSLNHTAMEMRSIKEAISPKLPWQSLKTQDDGTPPKALGWIRRRLTNERRSKKINVNRMQHSLAETWPTLYPKHNPPGHSTMRKWIEEEIESL